MSPTASRILVVDDEAPVRLTVAELLHRAGYAVQTAADGLAALALLEHDPVDLLILDLLMPGLSGWAVAQRVQAQYPGMIVLVLTGTSADAVEQARWASIGIDYLYKTSAPREVLRQVSAALTRLPITA